MKFQLWTEGYQATGSKACATYYGEFEAKTFRDAVIKFKATVESEQTRETIDTERLTFWGCKFFDNEEDARKSFG